MFRDIKSYKHFFATNIYASGLLIFICGLIGIGLVSLSSASLSFIGRENFFQKQIFWVSISIFTFLAGAIIDIDVLKKHSQAIFFLSLFLLTIVLIPGIGKSVNGSRRWIGIGPLNVQISEFAKFSTILWLSNYISKNIKQIKKFSEGFLKPLSICGLISGLIFFEPDYGSAVLIASVSLTMLFIAGTKIKFIVYAIFSGITAVSVLVLLSPVRLLRITSFLDVENNKLEGAYQLWQGILGFAAGGLYGNGIGKGRQQLTFLPEAHTDFIFAIIGEEFGAIATLSIVFGFALIFTICITQSLKIDDIFRQKLCQGIAIIISLQTIINISVATGLLPTKGMSLPFISYGGSGLALMLFMIGILLNTLNNNYGEE